MELSKSDMKVLKGIAILFMLLLHLFCRKDVHGLYETFPTINGVPFIYYLALFGDACVPIYCFASGYGLFRTEQGTNSFFRKNLIRVFKLLINYWIVLAVFVSVGFLLGLPEFPGSSRKFLLNFFVISSSYNGAWWFLQTYIILVLISPFLMKLTKKYNSANLLVISVIIYFFSYLQRIKHILDFSHNLALGLFVNAVVLVGTSLLPFLIGSVFAKERLYSNLYKRFETIRFKNTLCFICILLLVIIHSVFESMFIAPFTALAFICLFSLMDKNSQVQKLFIYFGQHSTNIWLTHMFFYMSIFPELTFTPRYPVLIFGWLIIMCLVSSYFINSIFKPLIRIIDIKASFLSLQEGNSAEHI